MEMSMLSELSRWLMSNLELQAQMGKSEWTKVFEACASPSEWDDFCKSSEGEAFMRLIGPQLQEIESKHVGVKSISKQRHSFVQLVDF